MSAFVESLAKMPDTVAYLLVGGSLLMLGVRRRARPAP